MKRILSVAVTLGMVFSMTLAGVVSAHTAAAECEAITITQTPSDEPADIYSEPDHTKILGPLQNGTYEVVPGNYQVRWPAWDNDAHEQDLTVVACPPPPAADLKVTKTADDASVSAGSQIGFTVKLENTGTGQAKDIDFTDALPGGAGINWSIVGTPPDWSITGTAPTQSLVYTPTTLDGGSSDTVHVISGTSAVSCATYSNTASATTTNGGQSSDSASTIVKCPDIKVTKTPDNGTVDAGETLTWTIKVENIGTGAATGVVATDSLPAGAHWTESEADCSLAGADGSQVLTCTVGSLAAGASKTYTVSATTSKANCGVINNTASASATNEPQGSLANNSNSGSVTVNCALMDVTKTADAPSVSAGSQIGFTVKVENKGAGTATGLTFTDNLPAGSGVNWSISPVSADWSITGAVGSQVLAYSPTTLAGNTSTTVHVISGTNADSCKSYSNTATVATGNDGGDADTATTTVNCPDIKVTKTPDNGHVDAGSVLTWTIKVENIGTGAAIGVVATDSLPAGAHWTESEADCSLAGADGSQVLTCTVGSLAAGASKTYTVSATTSKANCGVINNTASASATNEPQGSLANNSNSGSVTVNCALMDVTKTADAPSVSAGSQIGFTVKVENKGAGTATGLTFTDNLPAGSGVNWSISPVSADWSITGAVGSQVLAYSPTSLAGNSSTTVHIVSATSSESCKAYENTAKIESGNDGSSQMTATTTVLCANIDIDKIADDPSVVAGDTIGFTIKVTNNGTGTATGVHVSDVLPTDGGLDWSVGAVTGADAAGVTCIVTAGTLLCDRSALAYQGTFSVHISSSTTAATAADSPVDNEAKVITTNDGTDTADASVDVLIPDINAEKLVNGEHTSTNVPGDTLTYSIKVTNTGTAAGTADVSDNVMSILAHATIDNISDGGSLIGNLITWPQFSLDANTGSKTLTFTAHLKDSFPNGTTHLLNTVVVVATGSNCPAGEGDEDCDTDTTVTASPSIKAEKLVEGEHTSNNNPGDTLHYSIQLENKGDADGTADVSDDISAILAHATIGTISDGGTLTGDTITWPQLTIAANGGTKTLTFTVVLNASFPNGTTHLPNAVVLVSTGTNCPPLLHEEVAPAVQVFSDCDTDTTVEAHPDIHAEKTVDGEHDSNAVPGDVLDYAIKVDNSGAADGTADVSDDVSAILAHATIIDADISDGGHLVGNVITWPQFTLAANGGTKTLTFKATLDDVFPDGTTHLLNTVVVVGTGSNCIADEGNADCDTDTGVDKFQLTITKTNDAPIETLVLPDESTADLPTADEGTTVTYTLTYAVGDLTVDNGIITDVLPAGLQYVDSSATPSDEFSFVGYDAGTRTLTWNAEFVTKGGSVSYDALVLTGASELSQPLTNTATIVSDQTEPDSDTSDVFVPVIPQGETNIPTPPPTDVLAQTIPVNTTPSLFLMLAVLGALVLAIGFITPVPAAFKRRNRR